MHRMQNMSYPETRKIVKSRAPTAGVSYAATVSKTAQKMYQTIAAQTEYPIERNR